MKIRKENIISKKAGISYLQILILIISTFAVAYLIYSFGKENIVSAQTWPAFNVCCEKTKTGAWCQNTLEANCDEKLRKTPTSCEATSFCKQGCCYDSQEGLCMENTPQKVCNDKNGTYIDDAECNVKQCELGCCVLGNQASFVTLTRCKRLSGLFGLETNFRNDIRDEATCIAIAASQEQGACVYEAEYKRTCRFTTRGECLKTGEKNVTSGAEFFEDYLCSAEELAAGCGPSTKTMCVEGKDEVYFQDTCGNPANIYDASKINDKAYWKKRVDKGESCGYGNQKGNAGSKTCGNCDYFKGSICGKGSATYGDYFCRDLNCYNTENGKDYKNGESWCIYDGNTGKGSDAVGSRHFRHVCIAGEETIEPCDDYRNKVCIQAEVETGGGTFIEAACRVNRWQSCIDQEEEKDCNNTDRRDCYWLDGVHFTGLTKETTATTTKTTTTSSFTPSTTSGTLTTGKSITGYGLFGGDDEKEEEKGSGVQIGGGACLPNTPPGLKFWTEGDAQSICSLGNSKCVVTYEKGLLGSRKCVDNCECLEENYATKMNELCTSLGDCGAYVNIANKFTEDGAEWKVAGKKQKTIGKGILDEAKKKAGVTLTARAVSVENAASGEKSAIEKWFGKIGMATGLAVVSGTGSNLPIIGALSSGKLTQGGGGLVETASGITNVKLTDEISKKISPETWNKYPALTDTTMGSEVPFSYSYNQDEGLEFLLNNEKIPTKDGIELSKAFGVDASKAIESFSINSIPSDLKFGDVLKNGAGADLGSNSFKSVTELANGEIKVEYTTLDGATKSVTGKANQGIVSQLTSQAGGGEGLMGGIKSYFTDGLLQNLLSAATIGGLFALVGSFIGGNAVKVGFFAGFFGKMAADIASRAVGEGGKILGLTPGWFGVAVGAAIFLLMYKKTSTEIVEFNCLPWQPPVGGADCELCNDKKLIQCSEYRCKSLGQACELLNKGTKNEACAWVNPRDVTSPRIKVGSVLKGYIWKPDTAVRPPATGVVISKTDGNCVKAFTPLEFNLETDEPSQCRIDYNLTVSFNEMSYYVGGSDLFSYNHTEKMSLPGPDTINKVAPELKNDGTYTLYVRCQDANGNFNQDAFSVRFCVEAGPDTTPPKIESVSIPSNSPIQYNKTKLDVEVYVNEPAECKWSRLDRSYENMEYNMSCSTNVWEMNNNNVYTCKTTLTGIVDRKDNTYYFRCKDQPNEEEGNRNINTQSYIYTIIGTEPLNILSFGPNGTIKGSTDTIPVWLEVETANGYKNGEAICYYSTTGNEKDYIQFLETGTYLHKQRQDLATGQYTYYYKCVDLGGNAAYNSTKFKVDIDKTAPIIARAYKEVELLKIVTVENSECRYSIQSCNFKFEDGIDMPYANQTSHVAEWKTDNTYYIRCSDEYGNQPLPNSCSMIVRPYDVVEQKEEE